MDATARPTVLTEERARLAAIIERFRAGALSLWRFHGETLPFGKSGDTGVAHIADAFDSLRHHDVWVWPRGWAHLSAAEHELIDRCRRFLGTALPYEWPEPPATLLPELARAGLMLLWVGAVGHLLFALVIGLLGIWHDALILIANAVMLIVASGAALVGAIFAGRALRTWTETARRRYAAAGDGTVWPFVRREDYDAADPTVER